MDEETMQIKLFQIIYTVLSKQGKSNNEAFATAVVLSSNDIFVTILTDRRAELENLLKYCKNHEDYQDLS